MNNPTTTNFRYTMTRIIALGLGLVLGHIAGAADPAALESRVKLLAEAHGGKVAVAIKHLGTGEEFYLDADRPMPTASLIKLPVMVETYWQAEEGKVNLDATVTYKKDPKVQGSGILYNHFSDGATFPLKDAVRLMIVFSDNAATNMVLGQIGLPSTNRRMETLGLKNTKINAKVFLPETRLDQEFGKKYGLGSTTAREMVHLLERIEAGKVVTPVACKTMLGHLKACDDKEKLTRFLPAWTVVAHKTGSVNASKTDAGIIYIPDPANPKATLPVAVCVLTDENKDQRWVPDNEAQVTIGKIGKAVYDYFMERK
jgi:beta-lactamase class A